MKIRRKLRSIFSILLCVFMIVPNCTVAFAYDDQAIIDEYNSETPSNDPSIIVETNINDESNEVVSEEESEITSEEENSENKSEEDKSEEVMSEEENSKPKSEIETSEKEKSEEVTSEELNSEETSEEDIDKEDTKKSNIEVVFDEGVTVIIKNDDNTVKITRDDENIYVFDKDNNSSVGPYDDKYVINDFDVNEDIDVSFIANDNYILTNYSISNDEETIVEESEVEELNYNTQLTITENIYININTGIAEGTVDVSTLDDTQKYIYENVNSEYINKVTYFLPADMILLKSTVADKHKLSSESFEGLFTSNEDQIAEAFLYQTDDAIGLYDLNRKSDYLVGIADTLKDDDDFSIIDYTFAKSNTDAELLDGSFFDTETGLFYVPKSLIDYLEDGSINIGSKQLQILYAFDDGTDNVEVKEIEDEEGEVEEITVNTAAPKVFMRMAAPRLLGAAPDMSIPYGGMITGNVVEGDTIQIPMNYLYVTGSNAYINNTNVLADPSGSISFFASLLNGTTNISSLRANLSACFPHRLVVENPTNYTFNSGAVMTVYPGIYALECIHTKQQYGPNHAPKSPNTITARILSVNISGDSGYVYVGLTSPETYTQSGAGVIKLQYQNTTTVEEKFAGFRIQKKDNHGNTLSEGFKFVVYNESNRYLGIITTGTDGTAKMDNIKLPTNADSLKVRVQEISAPVGYSIDPHVYETYATEGGENTVSLTFVDTLLPKVTVRKIDTDGNWLKRDAYCQILDTNGNVVVDAFACGYEDRTVFLPEVGDYILHEYKTPEGYLQAEDIPFTVTDANTTTALLLTMSDPYITVEIDKFEIDDAGNVGGFLPGAILRLSEKEANGLYEQVEDWTTDDAGHVIKALPAGEYKLEELVAPTGYTRAKPLEFTVEAIVDLQTYSMYDPPNKLSILKVDENGQPLSGAKLALYKTTSTTSDGKTTYSKSDFIERWVSDGTPHILYELPADQVYYLEEEEAPPGYNSFGHQLICLGHQHTTACYTESTRRQYADGRSSSWIEWEEPCGCGGTVHHYKAVVSCSCGRTFTNTSGYACTHSPLGSFPQGCGNYRVANSDYDLHDHPVRKLICELPEADNLDNYVFTVRDTRNDSYGFQVAKTDANGNLLSGAELSVYKINGNSETLVRSFISTDTYELFFDVDPGTYKLVEDTPPNGYLPTESKTFTVNSTNKLVTITLEDAPTAIKVSKRLVNGTNIEDAYGAELEIVDSEGEVIDHWTSNGSEREITRKLSVNKTYTLREVEEMPGTVNAGKFNFSIDEEGNIIPSGSSEYYEVSEDKKSIICYNKLNSVKFIKQDENGNPLKGAILQLINKATGVVVETWVSGEDKNSNEEIIPHEIVGLPKGTYIWKEIQAPYGYFDPSETTEQEIIITNEAQTFTFTKTNIPNKVEFLKVDAKTNEMLSGATLSLWKLDSNGNPSSFIEKWVTDGTPHSITAIPAGDYMLFELELPEGYAYANNLINGNTHNSNLTFTVTNTTDTQRIIVEDPRIKAEFELLKVDSISGEPIVDDEAEFEFLEYNATTNSYEVSKHYWIDYIGDGYYSVFNDLNGVDDHYLEWTPENKGKFAYRETRAPYDAEMDPNTQYLDITTTELDNSTVMSNDISHVCPLHPAREYDPADPNVHKIYLGHNAKPAGGYDESFVIFNDPDLAAQYEGKVFANNVSRGGFELVKWDNDAIKSNKANTSQGDVADLSGFEFKVYNRTGRDVYVYPTGDIHSKVKVSNNGLVGVYTCDKNGNIISTATTNIFTTNSEGYVGIPHQSLQAGTYEIIETKAATGYLLPDETLRSITFEITKNDEYFHFEFGNITNETDIQSDTKYFADDIIRGDVQLIKYDKELNKSEVIGGKDHGNNTTSAKLNNIEFEIINKSSKPVYVNNQWYNKDAVVATITTHWNEAKLAYTAETTGNLLPYGSYAIREKAAGEGYIKTDAIRNFVIRENNKVVTADTFGDLLTFSNQVVRGNIQFTKIEKGVERHIKAPFLITNLTTGEKHVVVTDTNGKYTSAQTQGRLHSDNTNGNDWLIAKIEADPTYSAQKSDLDENAGLWFGLGEDGTIAPVDNTLCSLPYGDYELKELRCHSNEGLKLVTINFTVGKDSALDSNLVDLDVIYNEESAFPKIVSSAIDNSSNTHVAKAGQVVTVVDRITVSDLVSEDSYKVVGYLMNKSTGNRIKYNNADVTSEYSFIADGTTEVFNLPFTFDTTALAGDSVVVYLYLYKEGTLVDNEITNQAANINNISETVSIPTIHTSLTDEYTKDNVLTAETVDKSKVIDTVSYENLAINTATDYAETPAEITENQTYTIKGKLYDKATGQVVATSEVTFTPTTMSGIVEVPYEFNGVNGHIYVATEELYVNNVLVAEHNDLEDEAQTVYSPKVRTKAVDNTTNTQSGVIGENQIIRDTVYYENLVVGKTYTVKGTLMDKESNLPVVQNGAPITASKVFTASKANGNIELSFVVDTTLFKNRAIVVFEDLYHKDIKVYAHADINDEDQTVFYPELKTTAIDDNTNDNVATAGQTTITDTVQCSNLLIGHTYTVKGILIDKATGEYLGKDLGLTTPIVASKQFTAETKNPVIEVKFTLDGSLLQGKTCVVFEDIYHDDKLVATHGMLDDIDQTVYFPSVHTTAITDTGLKEQLALKGQLVYDYVELDNLVVGKDYTVKGKAYDKESELPIKDNGKEVTSELTFTATDTHMVIKLEFNISDASKLNGKTMVVFEKLYHNDYEVATHEDINDFEQSIKYPKIETTAFDIDTHLDEINPTETTTICDEIDFTNLEVGATYTIRGTIYRKDTNEPMKFTDGYVIGTTTFIAKTTPQIISQECAYVETLEELNTTLAGTNESTTELGETKSNEVVSGKVEVVFKDIDVKDLYGKTIVAFEYLYRDNVPIGIHANINDKNQDIKTLDINTFAREKESGIQEIICSKETNIVDTITLTNATENNTYTITSEIVDIDTDEVIARFKDDYTITNKNFVETKNGYNIYNVDINMTIDSSELGGRSFVIYEYVERNDVLLALHKDKDDLKQRLYFPYIRTTATDSETTEFDSLAEEDDMLIDTVKYENLTKGELYYVVGTLMDKETKAPVVIDGKEITSTTYFYAGEDKPLDTIPTKTRTDYVNSGEKVSGTIDVTFKFDSTSLAGKDVVVFEKAYTFDNIIVGEHEDIDDKDQTISYPKIGTTLLDKSTERHEGMAKSEAVYIDTVKYENLCVGKEYTVTGTLMDKSTGKPLTGKGATSTVTFTPTKANGEVEVKFVFDSSSLAGKVIVCFEDLYRNNHLVAAHTDLEDENQSVSVTPPPGSPTKYVKVKIAKADKLRTYYMLKGAEITIFNGDGTIAKDIYGKDCVGVTDENGLVWFHLYQNPWDHYYAQETKAPKGYAICNDKFAIYATDDMSKDADNAYQINVNIFDMWLLIPPKTGDNLPILPICLMTFLFSSTFITGVILLRRKRKH